MNTALNIGLFIIVNIIGFFSVTILWYLMVTNGSIEFESIDMNASNFKNEFFGGSIMVWGICAIFSFAALFIKSHMKYFIILAPAIVPYIYGFSVLTMRFGT